jgi:hypothetical protein
MASNNNSQCLLVSFFNWLSIRDKYGGPDLQSDVDGAANRSSLLSLDTSVIDVTWTEVVYGRLLYEALLHKIDVLTQLVAYLLTTEIGPSRTSLFLCMHACITRPLVSFFACIHVYFCYSITL